MHGFQKGLFRKTLQQLPEARDPPSGALCVDLRPGCEQRLNLPEVTALQKEDGNTRPVDTIREDKAVKEANTRKDAGPTHDTGLGVVKMGGIPPHSFQACTTQRMHHATHVPRDAHAKIKIQDSRESQMPVSCVPQQISNTLYSRALH